MFSVKSSLVALTLVASALATHIDVSRRHHQHVGRSNGTDVSERSLGKRKSGKFSFYEPEEVACGGHSTYNGRTFAWPLSDWGSGKCGTKVRITVNGKSEVGTCTDQCVGCPGDQLDLTPGWFSFFGSQDAGILHGTWEIVGGGDDNGGGDDGGNDGGNDNKGDNKGDDNNDDEEQKKKEAADKKKKEEAAAAAKEKADKEAKEKAEAASSSKSVASVASKSKASVAAKSSASVASVSKASVAAVASASSVAAAAKASAEAAAAAAAASPNPDTAEPTEAPQAVGASSSFGSNGAASLHVTIPTLLFSAFLGVAAVAL